METITPNQSDSLSRDEIKAARKLRNQQKREAKRAEKNATVKANQCGQDSVSVISRDLFNKINIEPHHTPAKEKRVVIASLIDLQTRNNQCCNPIEITSTNKNTNLASASLVANKLDKSQPVLRKGKHADKEKTPHISHLKKEILAAKSLHQETFNYVDNMISESLETLISSFISKIVEFQEKYYKRTPIKAAIKRRYIVGFHQVKKYIVTKKVHLFVIAADIKLSYKDPLHIIIEELVRLAKLNEICYVFALKRRQIGQLTLKSVPVSCFGVLNYDGLNCEFNSLLETINNYKEEFIASNSKVNCIP